MAESKQSQLINEIAGLASDLMSEWPSTRNKQKEFVLAYVSNGFINGTEAAKKAGYSAKTAGTIASNLLTGMKKYEHIPPVIEELKKAYDERAIELSIASGTEVLQYLTSVMRGSQKEQTLIGLGEGAQGLTDIDVGAKERLKAAELLGKRHALFTDKQEISATVRTDKLDSILQQLGDEDD
ncbi:terminase small subunit [Enterococcus faecalis]|nr:terminase small subunit [Enterococcus faecalis]EGO7752011.1 terminase small subunit [Enterococcus faecalis]